MIINGKDVEITIDFKKGVESFSELVLFSDMEMKLLIRDSLRSKTSPNIREMAYSYSAGDIDRLFEYGKIVTERLATGILRSHPELIVSERLELNISLILIRKADFHKDLNKPIARYIKEKSSVNNSFIEINLEFLLYYLLKSGIANVYGTMYHEFLHHLRIANFDKVENAMKSMNALVKQGKIPPNLNFGVSFMERTISEGPAEFGNLMKTTRKIFSSYWIFLQALEFYEKLSKQFEKKEVRKTIVKALTRLPYELGSVMTAMIVVSKLEDCGKGDMVLILPRFVLFGKKEYPISEIKKYYPKKMFDFCFIKSFETDKIIYSTLARLSALNHIAFLKEYEEVCRNLEVEPVLGIKQYSDWRKECNKNYKEYLSSKKK